MSYELAHDTIAKQVYEKASTEARTRRKVERFVRERHQAYQERGAYLTQDDLDYVTPYLRQVNLTEEEEQFITAGRYELVRKSRRRRLLIIGIIAILSLTTIVAIFQSQIANQERIAAEDARRDANDKADSLILKEQALQASLTEAKIANDTAEVRRIRAELAQQEADANALAANRARKSAEQRALEAKVLGIVNVARSLPVEQRDLALRLVQAAYEVPIAQQLPQTAEALADLFYLQTQEGTGTGYPLYEHILRHEDIVSTVRFSPDGEKVLTGGGDGWVKLWDRTTGELLRSVDLKSRVAFVEYSPNGKHIMVSTTSRVYHWRVDGTEEVRQLPRLKFNFRAMFSGDSQRILQVASNAVQVTNMKGEILLKIEQGKRLTFGRFSPDGETIWLGYDDGSIASFSSLDGSEQQRWQGHGSYIHWLTFSPEGDRFLALEDRGAAKIWTPNGELVYFLGNAKIANWSQDGTHLALGTQDGRLRVLKRDSVLVFEEKAHGDYIRYAEFSGDSRRILTVSGDGLSKVWDVEGHCTQILRGHQKDLRSARFSPDGRYVVTAGIDSTARIWPLSGIAMRQLKPDRRWYSLVNYLPENDYLVTQRNGNQSIWRGDGRLVAEDLGSWLPSGKVLEAPDGILISTKSGLSLLAGKQEEIVRLPADDPDRGFVDMFLSADKQSFITVDRTGLIERWNMQGEMISQFSMPHTLLKAAYAPGSELLSLVGYRDSVWVYDLAGQLLASITDGDQLDVTATAFSPSGRELYLAYQHRKVQRWSVKGRLLSEWEYEGSWVSFHKSLSSGKGIIASGPEGGVVFWSPNGRLLKMLPHTDILGRVRLSPDERWLLTSTQTQGFRDRKVFLWDIANEAVVYQWGDLQTDYEQAFFSADSKSVIVEGEDGEITYWPMVELIAEYLQKNAVIPELTPEQRKRYGIE